MMLSNFMRRNGKRKGAKNAKAPQAHPRQPSSSSPASFTSPEILDINEKSFDLYPQEDSTSETPGLLSEGSAPALLSNLGSPLVHLDLSTEPLEDWFPQELLRGNRSSRYSSFAGSSSRATANITDVVERDKPLGTRIEEPTRPVVAWKKSIPAPIVIPDADLLAPNVQVGHSAATTDGLPPQTSKFFVKEALPNVLPSPVSSEDMSAVSGTTLARALIANSFVLSSSEHRVSRHRSGIARQDSATLPRGDHWRDRPISRGEIFRPESGRTSPVPPVPPMPAGVLLERHSQRSSDIVDELQKLGSPESRPINSAPSTVSEYPSSASSYAASPEPVMYSSVSHRISRILEVPSPAPTTPMTSPSAPPLEVHHTSSRTSAAAQVPHVSTTGSEESDVYNDAMDGLSQRHSADHAVAESLPTAPLSPSPTDCSLDEYSFVPLGTQTSAVSPGSDSSASYIAPLPTKRGENSLKRRNYKVGAASFAEGRARVELNRGAKPVKLLPFKPPRPLLVPHTPITPALIASSLVAPYSTLSQFPLVPSSAVPAGHLEMPPSAKDHMDSSLNLATTSVSARQRSGVPDPTAVDQDYTDLLNYALTVSPDPGSSSHYTSTSSSAGYQTFPETPMVFSPLWSPDYSRPPGSALRFPLERKQIPRSATLPGPRGLGKILLARPTRSAGAGKEDEVMSNRASIPRRPQSTITAPSSQPESTSPPASAVPVVIPGPSTNDESTIPDLVSPPSLYTPDTRDDSVVTVYTSESNMPTFRPHPLAHISTSSSQLQEEEALQALGLHSGSSIPPIMATSDPSLIALASPIWNAEPYHVSPALVPLPDSANSSPLLPFDSPEVVSPSVPLHSDRLRQSPLISNHPKTPQASCAPFGGSSFLPSVSPALSSPVSPIATPPRSPSPISPNISSSSPSPVPSTPSLSFSFVAPPPYHAVVSERTAHHPLMFGGSEPLSRTPYERDRQLSLGVSQMPSSQNRMRARPRLPIGPRKPSGPAQPLGTLVPGIRERGNSVSSVSSSNHGAGPGSFSWRKLYSAASQPPPKFQLPPPKRNVNTVVTT
ncbi:hypothetical protein F5I97DRAFT_175864 [Phlebopus sp. FC_14]|nr:hypothetical protein F5I97DRAFT_175864 [Phlebopus sp. FC_14]